MYNHLNRAHQSNSYLFTKCKLQMSAITTTLTASTTIVLAINHQFSSLLQTLNCVSQMQDLRIDTVCFY